MAASTLVERRSRAFGFGAGVLGALGFGVTVVIGRSLAKAGLGVPTSLGGRFSLGALCLLAILAATGRPLLPAPGERAVVFLLGAVGYAVQSSMFFAGLERGTAAAVTLLFYAYPAMVALAEVPLRRRLPSAPTVGALALALAGVALIVASSGDVDITRAGIALSLAAGAMFAGYLLLSDRFIARTDPLTSAAWLAAGTGAALLAYGGARGDLRAPTGYWAHMVGYGAATAVAFAFTFAALRHIGPSHTAVVLTLETFFAVLLAAVFIDETVGGAQVVGGVAIVAAAAVIAVAPEAAPVDRTIEPP